MEAEVQRRINLKILQYKRLQLVRTSGQERSSTDTKNYRCVSIYPSTNDLVNPNREQLPLNIIKGPYQDLYEYLNTHFSLLREDFIKPVREDLASFLKHPQEKLHSITIHNVEVVWRSVKNSDKCFCIEIKNGVTDNSWNLKGDDSKRFMVGCLLIFSQNNFETIFCGRVVDNKHIVHKKVLVSFEDDVQLNYKQGYLMIECKNFFEPYYYVMKVLQATSTNTLSMQKYLIETKSSVGVPKYLEGKKYCLSDPKLNKSQLVAIKAALSQELVIIQGPPGTGKTFLGLKIAKILLSESKNWYNESPMLIISYTNHALDQFLGGLLGSTDRILRYGGQSKDTKMEAFSIGSCRDRFNETLRGQLSKRRIGPVYGKFCDIQKQINSIENRMNSITSKPNCIFNLNFLAKGVPKINIFAKKDTRDIVSWLLEEDGTIVGKNESATGFNVSSQTSGDRSEDAKKMALAYDSFVRNTHKPSKYCMISVSILENATCKLNERIVELTKDIEKKKKLELNVNQDGLKELNEMHMYLVRKLEYLKVCLNIDFKNDVDPEKVDMSRLFEMPVYVRWQLYKYWLNCYKKYLEKEMDLRINEYFPIYKEFDDEREWNNLELMKYQKVIGMTTTAAARLHSTIIELKCPIVIVEEAAEILEAHIIPALTAHCQHLILIGDHKQLKPATADYDIETRYKLGVSLFERMVNNNIQCHTLNVQHRMRPEISSLITPSIYPVLHDHESVKEFPRIKGLEKCVYFITHREPEEAAGDSSKKNIHEAKFLIQLAVYLLKNEYQPENITILAAYMGQVRALIAKQTESDYSEVKKVRITSVDDFQGEENKIILLSLVRNNSRNKIGFLSIENRVCVALSRAKEGMYVMGNMKQLYTCSKLWHKIAISLQTQGALGRTLTLKCQNHGELTAVQNAEDFDVVPDGGCGKTCDHFLSCGHKCQRYCHVEDLLHKKYKCTEACLRRACLLHRCLKKCYEECGQCTRRLTQKLNCRHYIKCYMQEEGDFKCKDVVNVKFPCGHQSHVSCHEVAEIVTNRKAGVKCFTCGVSGKPEKFIENDDEGADIIQLVNAMKI